MTGLPNDDELIALSKAMKNVVELIQRIALVNVPVLILGESGVGKEIVARNLHKASPRRNERFVSENCGAIPPGLIEARFFGYERGAFTSADKQTEGVFEMAHQGTLFLDELGELSPEAQADLLRVIEHGEIRRIGSKVDQIVDVRIIAATNEDLIRRMSEGLFRRDLYYRLNVFPIRVPPLRERYEDFAEIVEVLIKRISISAKIERKSISREALALLASHRWPGNVRELRNILTRALILAKDHAQLSIDDIYEAFRLENNIAAPGTDDPQRTVEKIRLVDRVQRYEATELFQCLHENEWNFSAAANALGVSLGYIRRKIRLYGLRPDKKLESVETLCGSCASCVFAVGDRFLPQRLLFFEACLLNNALQSCRGNRYQAAALLHLSERTFYRKLDQIRKLTNGAECQSKAVTMTDIV